MPGSLVHLTRRFFDFLTARPLSDEQEGRVRVWLSLPEQTIFFEQDPRDQAHGLHAAEVVIDAGLSAVDAISAALLHDVGKRHSDLGIVRRSIASMMIKLRLPLSRSMKSYRDHGLIGADDLTAIGSVALAREFARHHHGDRPETIDIQLWNVLQIADQPRKPSVRRRHR